MRFVRIHEYHFFSQTTWKTFRRCVFKRSNLCFNASICIQTRSCYKSNLGPCFWLSRLITGFLTTMTIITSTTSFSKYNSVWIISILLDLHVKRINNFTVWFKLSAISCNCFWNIQFLQPVAIATIFQQFWLRREWEKQN